MTETLTRKQKLELLASYHKEEEIAGKALQAAQNDLIRAKGFVEAWNGKRVMAEKAVEEAERKLRDIDGKQERLGLEIAEGDLDGS